MFGFSLTKLVVLVVIVGAVLVLFRFIGQRTAVPPVSKNKPKAFNTAYDAESDTFVVREDKNQDK
jgi:NADH:ubiquinone oxidoreductase subunit 6 (subunit J)